MEEIVISDKKNFENKKDKFISEGVNKIHVLADFDKTLTKAFVDGEKFPSVISILRKDGTYLGEDYAMRARKLFEKYHPYENDFNLSLEKRKKYMNQWWSEHFNLIIEKGLNKSHLEKIIKEENICLRKGFSGFVNYLKDKNIPLVIISSSGIGNLIPMILERENLLYEGVYIISNFYEWDSSGKAIKVKEPFIHSLNKDETVLKEIPEIYNKIESRKNVLLLGDSIGDLEMVAGFNYNNLISIGFLNDGVEENLELYKKNFDVIVTNDGTLDWVNRFLEEIA